jgi:hypothetical protein
MKKEYQKIIFTHVPKTAGTAFRYMLYDAFGQENILHDYDDDPVNPLSRFSIDPDYYRRNKIISLGKYKIVHGHFGPSKYRYVDNAIRIAFLRDPVDNIVSIYYYWKTLDRTDSPILNYVRDNNLSIIEFASLTKIRWLYTKTYFGDCDMSTFDFLGKFSRFNEDLNKLSELLGVKLDNTICVNRTGEKDPMVQELKNNSLEDHALRKKLTSLLSDDIKFCEMV